METQVEISGVVSDDSCGFRLVCTECGESELVLDGVMLEDIVIGSSIDFSDDKVISCKSCSNVVEFS